MPFKQQRGSKVKRQSVRGIYDEEEHSQSATVEHSGLKVNFEGLIDMLSVDCCKTGLIAERLGCADCRYYFFCERGTGGYVLKRFAEI